MWQIVLEFTLLTLRLRQFKISRKAFSDVMDLDYIL